MYLPPWASSWIVLQSTIISLQQVQRQIRPNESSIAGPIRAPRVMSTRTRLLQYHGRGTGNLTGNKVEGRLRVASYKEMCTLGVWENVRLNRVGEWWMMSYSPFVQVPVPYGGWGVTYSVIHYHYPKKSLSVLHRS